jgi:hypothetical protein
MRRNLRILPGLFVEFLVLVAFCASARPAQGQSQKPADASAPVQIRIWLRQPDNSPFTGLVTVRLTSAGGAEVAGKSSESGSEIAYADLQPGAYRFSAVAPGFESQPETIEVKSRTSLATVYVVMKPGTVVASADLKTVSTDASAPAKKLSRAEKKKIAKNFWHPPDIDSNPPALASAAPCPLGDVLGSVSDRTQQFAADLEKFRATERIQHFEVDKKGTRYAPESRTFDYVVAVGHYPNGALHIEEYRNGSQDPHNFPEKIDTLGLPAFALLFQPRLAADFTFSCEGLGQWRGRPAWLVRFEQRPDRPSEMRAYMVNNFTYPIALKGRAWIDAATMQVIHLESDLSKPAFLIDLTLEHFSIDYAPVRFHTKDVQLWLPQDAALYVEQRKHRYYREHSFRNFQCFAVEASQVIAAPADSYAFTNRSDHDVSGVLTVTPVAGAELSVPISIRFKIAPGARVFKAVGKGKDVDLAAGSVASATFAHDGDAASVSAEAFFSRETTLELISDAPVASATPNASAGPTTAVQ